jgi:hypothetical protein
MDKNFIRAAIVSGDFLSYLGQWLLYDGGLCVNRCLEEHIESNAAWVASRGRGLAI